MSKSLTLGVVLAGGKSSRMGQDKALLDIKGQSFVSNVLNLLQLSNVDEVVLSGRTSEVVQYILDKKAYLGPADAMLNIMKDEKFLQFDNFVFVPVDMPLLTVDILNSLCVENESCFYGADYLPCKLNRKHIEAISSVVSVKDILQQSSAISLPIHSRQFDCFVNINTPAEYKKIIK